MSLLRRCNDLTTFIYFYSPIIVAVLGFNLLVIFLFWGRNPGSAFGSEWLLWIHPSLKGQVTADHKCACVHAQSWCGLNGIYVGCGCLKPCWQGGVCLWSFFTFTFYLFIFFVCLGFFVEHLQLWKNCSPLHFFLLKSLSNEGYSAKYWFLNFFLR